MFWKKTFPAIVVACACSLPAVSQSADFSLSLLPTLTIPMGPVVDGDLQLFSLGGGGSLRGELIPGFARFLYGRISLDCDYLPYNGGGGGWGLIAGGGSVGLSLNPLPRMGFRVGGGGGLYMAFAEDGTMKDPYVEGGLDLTIRLGPTFSMGLGGKYRYLFTPSDPIQDISVQLGVGYDLGGGRKGTEIRIEPRLSPIFPLFYSYYDKNPAGEVVIANTEANPYEKVSVAFYAKQYMDGPRLCAELGTLRGGESRTVPVYALFNDAIFRVTEGTKAAGEIQVSYFYLGKERKVSFPVTVQVENRNAMQWDDDRKAAAFVTAKDPLILSFAKNVASTVRSEGTPPVTEDFRTALALFQSLTIYGLGYTVDPKTPFTSLSGDETAVDFLQFPNQTLAYRAGDCDDLSVLYAALLESVGLTAALVTTPGHIFVAFDSGLSADAAERFFSAQDDLVIRDGKAWVPVEVTLVKEGFVRSWRMASQEWRTAEAEGKAGFYPVRESWKVYEPVGFVEGGVAVAIPPAERIAEGYRREMKRFLDTQVGPRVAAIQDRGKASGKNSTQIANQVGVLYAQFGMLDKASEQFKAASKGGDYAPALTNMGNVLYLKGDMKGASDYFTRSLAIAPDSAATLAGIVRASYALEDFTKMNTAMTRLRTLSPALAAKLDVTGGAVTTARAAEADTREVAAWDD